MKSCRVFRLPPHVVGKSITDRKYSLRIEESTKEQGGELASKFTTVKLVEVASIGAVEGVDKPGIAVVQSFAEAALGRDVSVDKPTSEEMSAVEAAVRVVLGGVNKISKYCLSQGIEVALNDLGRPQLREEIDREVF